MNKAITLVAALLLSSSVMAMTTSSNQTTDLDDARFLDEASYQVDTVQITNSVTQLDEKQDYSLSQQRPTPELLSGNNGFASVDIELSSIAE
jgi:hypothetical protein